MLRHRTNILNIPFHVRRQYPIWYYHFGSQRFHMHPNSWIPYIPDQHLDEIDSMIVLHFHSKQTISAAILRNKKFHNVTKFRMPRLYYAVTMDCHDKCIFATYHSNNLSISTNLLPLQIHPWHQNIFYIFVWLLVLFKNLTKRH